MNTNDFKTRSEFIHRKAPCPDDYWVVGLDIGYSAVKGMSPNKVYCFPAYARQIPSDRIILREPRETDIRYEDEEGSWVVGNLAYEEVVASEVVDSESELFGRNRYYSSMFRVIARVGIALGLITNSYGCSRDKKLKIQTGLPPKYEKEDQVYLKDALSGTHKFRLRIGRAPWQKFEFTIHEGDIEVMPQPLGALVSASVGENGKPLPVARKYFSSNLIIFDPGFGTTDDYVVNQGNVIDSNTFPNLAMKEVFARTCKAIKDIYGEDIEIPELQNYLESGEIRMMNHKEMKRTKQPFASFMEEACKVSARKQLRR